MMGGQRVDLDGQAADFRYHLERAEPGSGLEECARWGLNLAAELRPARAFRDAVAKALAPGRWRGFDGPDGVDPLEVIEDVAQALERHDQATGQPDPAAGHADPEGPP